MKAKDTVMSDEQIYQAAGIEWNSSHLRVAQAQAEITAPIFFKEGHKAGIKEVIKQLDIIDEEAYDTKDFTRRVCDLIVEWQAKLKEVE